MAEAGMQGVRRRHRLAIVVHIYYPDLWREFKPLLLRLDRRFDLFVTIPHDVAIKEASIRRDFPGVHIHRCDNRGRDVAPFLAVFSAIARLGYTGICKLHTKSSPHLIDGRAWRVDMLRKLIGSSRTVSKIVHAFAEHPDWGVIAPLGHVVPRELYWCRNAASVRRLATAMGIDDETQPFSFVAGSMFWFRPQALLPLTELEIVTSDFEPETGAYDGTLAHAFERLFGLLAMHQGYRIAESDGLDVRPSEIAYHFRLLAQTFDAQMERDHAAANAGSQRSEEPSLSGTEATPPAEVPPWVLAELDQRRRDVDELTRLMTEGAARESFLSDALATVRSDAGRLADELAGAQQRESEVQAELGREQDRTRLGNARIEDLTRDLAAVTDQLQAMRAVLDAANARSSADDARIQSLTGDLAAANSRLQSVQTDLDGARNRIAADNTRIQNLTGVLAAANSHLQSVQAQLEGARNRIGADGARITNLTDDVAAAADRVRHVTAELEQARGRIAGDEARINRLNGELAAVRQQLQDVLATRSWRWTAPLRKIQGLNSRTRQ